MTDLPGGSITAQGSFAIAPVKLPPAQLVIGPVRISLEDGSIEYGDGYTPDETARTFWEAMSKPLSTSLAAVERVRTIHHHVECSNVRCKTGGWCIGCDPTGSDDCSEHPWPCPTVLALEPGAQMPDQYAAWMLKRDHDRRVAAVRRLHERYRDVEAVGDDYSCAHCNQLTGYRVPWPCPTIQALEQP